MGVRVMLPGSLKRWLGGNDEVDCPGATLGECIDFLDGRFPGFRARVVGEDGQLSPTVLVFVNGENARTLGGLDARVRDGDEAGILPLAAGG